MHLASKKRESASIERKGGLNKREQIWSEIRKNKQFSVAELHVHLQGMTKGSVHHYLQCLCAGGFLEVDKAVKPMRYVLVKDCGVQAPRLRKDGSVVTQGRVHENLWRTMKILKTFDWQQLACVASLPELVIDPLTAKRYVLDLHKVGYLICLRQGKAGVRAVYRFNTRMNTGGRAPLVQRDRQLYDPNLGRLVDGEK